MKSLNEYNLDIQFPAHIESEILFNRDEYADLLVRKGYAYDPNAPKEVNLPVPKEVSLEVPKSPLSEESVEKMFDAIEAKAKADFAVRRRGPNKPKPEVKE